MKKFKNYRDIDFANDGQFIDWVINPDVKKKIYWQKIEKTYPEQIKEIKLARKIVLGFYPHERQIQKEKIDKIWNELTHGRKMKKHYLYAAVMPNAKRDSNTIIKANE